MKGYPLFLFVCLLSLSVYGQDSASTAGPARRLGVSFQLANPVYDDLNLQVFNIDNESVDDHDVTHSSYAAGLLLRYSGKGDTKLRLRLGLTRIGILEYTPDEFQGRERSIRETSYTGKQWKLHLAPGAVWGMGKGKLRLLAGFELPLNLHGEFTLVQESITRDRYDRQEWQSTYLTEVTLPRGYSLGVGAITGFDYLATERLSVGAEISPSLSYARLSGRTRRADTAYLSDGTVTYTEDGSYTQDAYKGYTFYSFRFAFNVTLWLGPSGRR